MASRLDSNNKREASNQDSSNKHEASPQKTSCKKPPRTSRKDEQPPIPLRRLVVRIYLYLKARMNRSRSEHILFLETVAIIDWLNPTERAALMATRETRSGQKPDPLSFKNILEFTEMRKAFLNRSPKRLPPTTGAEPPYPKRYCTPQDAYRELSGTASPAQTYYADSQDAS